jgi:hypothetical protein
MICKYTEEEKINMMSFAEQELVISDIAFVLNRDKNKIKRFLDKSNIKIVNPHKYKTTHIINKSFWIEKNEYFWYFLGLFWADGYNDEKFGVVKITLQDRDRQVLSHLRNLIQPTKRLYEMNLNSHTQPTVTLAINSRELSELISSWGGTKNKTYEAGWPKIDIPIKYLRDFIRGFIDGDGCIYKRPNKNSISLSCTGYVTFISALHLVLKDKFEIKGGVYQIKNCSPGIVSFCTEGTKKVKKILEWLYKSSAISIPRKYQKYLTVVSNG